MPEQETEPSQLTEALTRATAEVAARLAQLPGSVQALSEADLASYPGRSFSAGWRLPVACGDHQRRFDVLLPGGFPWQTPRIALVDRPSFLTWPHIERDGLLCLASSNQSVDAERPGDVVLHQLNEAVQMVEKLQRGECIEDFRDEFLSYWGFAADTDGTKIISLLDPVPPTRRVRLWRGKTLYIVGDSDPAIEAWLTNRFGKTPAAFKTDAAALLWVGTPLLPNEYPQSAQDLRALAARTGHAATELLADLAFAQPDKIVSMLGFNTVNGPALAAASVGPPVAPKRGSRQPLIAGFRPGKIPREVLVMRYFGAGALKRSSVERADAGWVHGRGADARAFSLRGKTVMVIGCGSIGAPVAVALAQAGVGRLVLIDPGSMEWANTGRHPLGAPYVGLPKSPSLAERLRADFPSTAVEHHVADIATILRGRPDVLEAADLVFSATGSWAAEGQLDAWRRAQSRDLPVVYAWTEAHACAGHALLLNERAVNLRDGFDGTGLPRLRVTAWPEGFTEQQEPACGAVYQPYGPVELGFVTSLTAELALDALLNPDRQPIHRVWAGPVRRLTELGGTWTPEWRAIAADRPDGGFVLERSWRDAEDSRAAEVKAA